MLAVVDEEIAERSLRVEGIGQHHIEGSGIALQAPRQQTQSTGYFIFSGLLRFHIQQEA